MTIRTYSSFSLLAALALAGCKDEIPFYFFGDVAPTDVDEGDSAGDVGEDAADTEEDVSSDPDPDSDVVDDASDTAPGDTAEDAGEDTVEDVDPDAERICEPNERRCVDESSAETCSTDGLQWTATPCDDGTFCLGGACVAEACEPGSQVCDGDDDLLICDSLGSSYDVTPCAERSECAGTELGCSCVVDECIAWVCEPGTSECDGHGVVTCLANGSGYEEPEECAEGCDAGACIETCPGLESRSHLGCSFWGVDLENFASIDEAPFVLIVSNGGAGDAFVTVTRVSDGVAVWDGMVREGTPAIVEPGELSVEGSALTSGSFHIVSDAPISVTQYNPLDATRVYSADSSLLLPETALGAEYNVLGWPAVNAGPQTMNSSMVVIAVAEGDTEVEIMAPVPTEAGVGVGGLPAGATRTVTLVQGQVLTLSTSDLAPYGFSGATVLASQPVAVFSASACARVPTDNDFCDMLEEQLAPTSVWGTEYVAAKFSPRGEEPDVWRVLAAQDGTTIETSPAIEGAHGRTINRGELLEFQSTESFVLESSAPVSLGQFMVGSQFPGTAAGCFGVGSAACAIQRGCDAGGALGDPAFAQAVPSDRLLDEYLFEVPDTAAEHYVSVVSPLGSAVTLDGVVISGPSSVIDAWEVTHLTVEPGPHHLAGSDPLGAYLYGYDCGSSYAHPIGMGL